MKSDGGSLRIGSSPIAADQSQPTIHVANQRANIRFGCQNIKPALETKTSTEFTATKLYVSPTTRHSSELYNMVYRLGYFGILSSLRLYGVRNLRQRGLVHVI